jgi:hypothetical protein
MRRMPGNRNAPALITGIQHQGLRWIISMYHNLDINLLRVVNFFIPALYDAPIA